MRIAVTGANGLLGSRCASILGSRYPVIPLYHETLEVTDMGNVLHVLNEVRPDAVVHCAAIPDPDTCEQDPDLAYRINVLGTRNVAVGCREIGATIAYISSDFVFDGTKGDFYDEFDKPNQVNLYGKTKYLGELFVQQQVPNHFILRVSWLFDEKFVSNVVSRAKSGETLELIADKFSSPTFTEDVATALGALLETKLFGTYHVANHGVCSRVGQAEEILRQAGLSTACIKGITGKENKKWVATRPDRTPLKPYLLELQGIHKMPTYADAVRRCLERISI